jgi:hypothetical protein
LEQAPVEAVWQPTLAHPKAHVGRALAQILATASLISNETLKGNDIHAAQTLGLSRVHNGIGEGNTITMFPFMPLQVSQILLERKAFSRPGPTTPKQQFSATAELILRNGQGFHVVQYERSTVGDFFLCNAT